MKTVTVAISGASGEPFGGCWSFPSPTEKVHLFFNSDEYKDVKVTAVPEDVGTVGALRAIGHHLSAKDILVVSGDLVNDIPPGALAAAHRRHDVVVTAMLCSVPASGPSDSA